MTKNSRRAATALWMMSVALGGEAAYADKILGRELAQPCVPPERLSAS